MLRRNTIGSVGPRSRRPPASARSGELSVVLVNNMPDAALRDTEAQFLNLLEGAACSRAVRVSFCSLPSVPRGETARAHIARNYLTLSELCNGRPVDGLIVTGAEPRTPSLRHEAYWPELLQLFAWAEDNTSSVILSCLAAHAAVLAADGVERHLLPTKRCGVFACAPIVDHPLLRGILEPIPLPHSRWNELWESELTAAGYRLLTRAEIAGVDIFEKRRRASLFLHLQGHPEYGAHTLLKEYRRDVKRFLTGERTDFPVLPYGYFDEIGERAFREFQANALADARPELMSLFPDAAATSLRARWHGAALRLYANWLDWLQAARPSLAMVAVHGSV